MLTASLHAGSGQRRKAKDDKGKLSSRPSSGKVYSPMDALTARMPGGSALRSPHTPDASPAAAQAPLAAAASAPTAPVQPAATAPPDLVPTAAPLPPLGAATAAAVTAISKAGATPGHPPGAVAVTISAAAPQVAAAVPAEPAAVAGLGLTVATDAAEKQPGSKAGPGRPPGSKGTPRQNGRRITTRYCADTV